MMKMLVRTLLTLFVFTGVALALDGGFKTRFITGAPLTIKVKDGQFITIRSFTQDQAAGQRGVIVAGVNPTPTPAPTPAATPTPTPTPVATPASADLTATKSNSVSGNGTFPTPWTWTIRVANGGGTAAT